MFVHDRKQHWDVGGFYHHRKPGSENRVIFRADRPLVKPLTASLMCWPNPSARYCDGPVGSRVTITNENCDGGPPRNAEISATAIPPHAIDFESGLIVVYA
jgi:hypothetical protein